MATMATLSKIAALATRKTAGSLGPSRARVGRVHIAQSKVCRRAKVAARKTLRARVWTLIDRSPPHLRCLAVVAIETQWFDDTYRAELSPGKESNAKLRKPRKGTENATTEFRTPTAS